MSFFQRQDKARRNTRWLVVMFIVAVVSIVLAIDLVVAVVVSVVGNDGSDTPTTDPDITWTTPEAFNSTEDLQVAVGEYVLAFMEEQQGGNSLEDSEVARRYESQDDMAKIFGTVPEPRKLPNRQRLDREP